MIRFSHPRPGQVEQLRRRIGKRGEYVSGRQAPERSHRKQSLRTGAASLEIICGHSEGDDLDRGDQVPGPDTRVAGCGCDGDRLRHSVAALQLFRVDLDQSVSRRNNVDTPTERLADLGSVSRYGFRQERCRGILADIVGSRPGHGEFRNPSPADGIDISGAEDAAFSEACPPDTHRMGEDCVFARRRGL